MAKRQVFGGGMVVHFTNEPEDYLICDAIDKVDPFVPRENTLWADFKYFYLQEGKGVRDRNLMDLNSHLKRKGLPIIVLKSTHSDSHSAYNGMDKAKARDAIMAHLKSLSPDHRTLVLTRQRHLIEMQPEYDGVEEPVILAPSVAPQPIMPLPLKGSRPEPIQVSAPAPVAEAAPIAVAPDKALNVNAGSVWMNRDGARKRVQPADVEQRLAEGWIRGVVPSKAPQASIKRPEQPERAVEPPQVAIPKPEPIAQPQPLPPDPSADIRRLWSEISILHAEVERLTDEVDRLQGPRRRRGVMPAPGTGPIDYRSSWR